MKEILMTTAFMWSLCSVAIVFIICKTWIIGLRMDARHELARIEKGIMPRNNVKINK